MYPDAVSVVVPTTAPVTVVADTEVFLTGVSLIEANKLFRYPKVRLEVKVSATLIPTTLHIRAQYRSAGGTWFDCIQTGWTEIDFVGGATELTPNPVVGVFGWAEGDEIRIAYKGTDCTAANYYTILEMNIVKLV